MEILFDVASHESEMDENESAHISLKMIDSWLKNVDKIKIVLFFAETKNMTKTRRHFHSNCAVVFCLSEDFCKKVVKYKGIFSRDCVAKRSY